MADDDRVIASGTFEPGFVRSMDVGGTDDAYWTGLRVTGPGDHRQSGGMGGPKLWGDDLLNTTRRGRRRAADDRGAG